MVFAFYLFKKCGNTNCLLLVDCIYNVRKQLFQSTLISYFDLKVCLAKHTHDKPPQRACFLGNGRTEKVFKRQFSVLCRKARGHQRVDVAQEMSQLPDQKQLRKWSGPQFQFPCPKARASPSLPTDMKYVMCSGFSRAHNSRAATALQRPRSPELEQCD